MSGAFARSLTGFGGSILFELVYNLYVETCATDLSDEVLMVSLASVFEVFTSTVLFALVLREALKQYRMLFSLSLLALPATLAGTALLCQLDAYPSARVTIQVGLNGLFLLVAMYKLSSEVGSKEGALNEILLPESDPAVLFRRLRADMLLVGLSAGFMNGFIGLPGPVIMVYFATAMGSGKLGVTEGYAITQGFFMLTTIFRVSALGSRPGLLRALQEQWVLFAIIPVPSFLALLFGFWLRPRINPATALKVILLMLLASSLVGTGALQGTTPGLCSVVCTFGWAAWASWRSMTRAQAST
jgi:uncharacterized membrane protein YfcA